MFAICIGKYLILRANWPKKLNEPICQVYFVHFEQFPSAYYTKFQEKLCYYLLIIYMKLLQGKARQIKFWECAQFL